MNDDDEQITVFAETNFRNNFRKFGIKSDDRRRHMYLIGKTGMGKSTVLENMIINDIKAGRGVVVVDPHGDLAEKVIDFIPDNRVNDVIYFNPADIDYPIAFNVIEHVEPHLRHLVASGLIGVFQKLWADSWGPRLEYILRNAILAILDYPDSTLLGITRILSDKVFRKKVIDKIQNPVVKAFWVNEFASYADKFASEAVSPIQNKVGQFLSSSLIRNIVGQVKSSIDLREVMDQGKILILNLSKGRIGEDNSSLLGAMMITKIQLAVMSRVDIPEKERRDFYLYIDEFQNFTTDSFANILSEARKYRLNLIMAHQYVEQLGETVKPAVFGNVGTIVVFRVGAIDAEELVKEFTPVFIEDDLVNLPKFEFYIKLMIDGIASDPFSARGLAPLSEEEKTNNKEKLIRVSRERYAKKRETVEEKIFRWHDNDEKLPQTNATVRSPEIKRDKPRGIAVGSIPQGNKDFLLKNSQTVNPVSNSGGLFLPKTNQPLVKNPVGIIPKPNISAVRPIIISNSVKNGDKTIVAPMVGEKSVYKFEAICSHCNNLTKLSFKPDGIRPIFCKGCLARIHLEKQQNVGARVVAKKEELVRLNNKKDFFAPIYPSHSARQERGRQDGEKNQGLSLKQVFVRKPVKFSRLARGINNKPNILTEKTKPEVNNTEQDLPEDKDITIE
ncbi:MAG: type IV secretion system DNA-binding domain-containing protein [Patescibacteria group bacterium]